MNEEEKKALKEATDKINLKYAELEKAIEKKASAEVIETLKADLKKTSDEAILKAEKQINEANEKLVKQGEEISKLKLVHSQRPERKSFGAKLSDAVTGEANKAKLENIASKKSTWEEISVKAAVTVDTADYNSGTGQALNFLDPIVGIIPKRDPFITQLINVGRISSNKVVYIDQVTQYPTSPNTAYQVAEGAQKIQRSFLYQETVLATKKIAPFTKVSQEMLADLSFVESQIRNDLAREVALALDYQVLLGGGTGDDMKGINAFATAFAASNVINNANHIDVLLAAVAQVKLAYFQPTAIIMNPADVFYLMTNKTSYGEYTYPMFMGMNGTTPSIGGIPIVANTGMTAGSFLVGDFSKSNLLVREDVNIKVGYDGNDFTYNLVTMLAELRAVHYVKANHVTAFVKGTFAAAIGDLSS